jgi:NitT/TauT family transport system substrate-binding protein
MPLHRVRFALIPAMLIMLCAGLPAQAADVVKVGVLKVPQTVFVALDKGYFSAENIDVQPVFFQSGAELVPSLATGQIDVAATSAGAALFNAIAQGSQVTIVGDHWVAARNAPSGDSQFIAVRKDLLADGKFKSAKDAKGMTIAVTARGQVSDLFMRKFLESGGLTESDVHIVTMPYPDMLAAFANKAIDMACAIDPYITIAEQQGVGQRVVSESALLPGVVQAVTMYGDRLGKTDRGLGMRFMRALTKANAYVRDRLQTPAGRHEIAQIYQKYVPLANAGLYEKIGLGTGPLDLAVDVDGKYGLRWEENAYAQAGLIAKPPDIKLAVDNSFADAAAAHQK